MYTARKTPPLRREGYCPGCNTWLHMGSKDQLPEHDSRKTKRRCYLSTCDPKQYRFVIVSDGEARQVAEFLKAYEGECLMSRYHDHHTPELCNSGKHCAEIVLMYSKAFATYMLHFLE